MDLVANVGFLANSPLFQDIASADIVDIAALASAQHFQPGDMIVWQGEIRMIKHELQQEAIAFEVDQKLILI